MKNTFSSTVLALSLLLLFLSLFGCKENQAEDGQLLADNDMDKNQSTRPATELSPEFKAYWYGGNAELTSYSIEQARYGELRDGHAVLVYVTEPFLEDKQVKADNANKNSVSVLKLNSTKKYLTGIYPYSVMTSVFYPVDNNRHALKISNSVQEWCGHVYAQLNNRENFEIMAHSYFESEADQDMELPKTWLEDEFWTMLRIDPSSLPEGKHRVLPSFEYIRLGHIPFKPTSAELKNTIFGNIGTYTVSYPDIDRELTIEYSTEFPYEIAGWKETFRSGFGPEAPMLTSSATRLKSLKLPYWQRNQNKDVILRDSLGL